MERIFKPMPHSASNVCFGCGPANEHGLRLEFQVAADGEVLCEAEIAALYCGHPGYLHGGIIATLLDEAMSKAVRATGSSSMTRRMEVEYLLPVPARKLLRIGGRIERREGRKAWTRAEIVDAEGLRLATAKGLFIEIKPRVE